jgi:ATP-dependent RNA helicase HelY
MARSFKGYKNKGGPGPIPRKGRRDRFQGTRPAQGNNHRHLRPAAESRLKNVFASIGTPKKRPFIPDRFQVEALEAISLADCLVTAPTGAGKTWIAERSIDKIFKTGGRCWYASPLKALTNAKLQEFSAIFGADNVGILTGDRKENPDAPIIVGTTEILRNQLYDAMHLGVTLLTDFVILDEAHFLGDPDRGVVWEESIIYLPQRIPLLLLSATVGNAAKIAQWIETIRGRQCRIVSESNRPVPLYPLFLDPNGTLMPLMIQKNSRGKGKHRLYKKVEDYAIKRHPQRFLRAGRLPIFGEILKILRKYNLLPAIFFMKSRADCDAALDLCQSNYIHDPKRAELLSQRIETVLSQQSHLQHHRQRWHAEHLAVGAHHSGQLPCWKIFLETLMCEGRLDAVFATSTVAAGVNFPARTVVILNSDRFNGHEFIPLTATEFHQMTGRAGRRGMDRIGFALALPGRYMDLRHLGRLVNSQPGHVLSQIRINFSMTLNLLLSHRPEEVQALLKRSFAAFLMTKNRHLRQTQGDSDYLWKDFLRHLRFLKTTGFADQKDHLSPDGLWAAQLRIDQPLMVAEGLRCNLFPDSDPALLAGIMASLVYEKESDDRLEGKLLSNQLRKTFFKIQKGLQPFDHKLQVNGFITRPMYLRPCAMLFAWASGHSFDNVCLNYAMAEGDLAMLAMRTADNLRHIANLKTVFPKAATTAKQAIELILRPPILPEGELKETA